MISYPIGHSGQRLIFTSEVIAHFRQYRQTRCWHREAGGQLFARFELPDILVEKATGPRRSDWRTRHSYRPNRRAEQREIAAQHRLGLHFIGDWHTHPELIPAPSGEDKASMEDMFRRSDHALNGFVLVIIGTEPSPAGMFVSVVGRTTQVVLQHQVGTEQERARGGLCATHSRSQ